MNELIRQNTESPDLDLDNRVSLNLINSITDADRRNTPNDVRQSAGSSSYQLPALDVVFPGHEGPTNWNRENGAHVHRTEIASRPEDPSRAQVPRTDAVNSNGSTPLRPNPLPERPQHEDLNQFSGSQPNRTTSRTEQDSRTPGSRVPNSTDGQNVIEQGSRTPGSRVPNLPDSQNVIEPRSSTPGPRIPNLRDQNFFEEPVYEAPEPIVPRSPETKRDTEQQQINNADVERSPEFQHVFETLFNNPEGRDALLNGHFGNGPAREQFETAIRNLFSQHGPEALQVLCGYMNHGMHQRGWHMQYDGATGILSIGRRGEEQTGTIPHNSRPMDILRLR